MWLSLSARIEPRQAPSGELGEGAALRLGITVPKRHARRAVARNLVKRVIREAARHQAAALVGAAPQARIDVLVRLKANLPSAAECGLARLKAELRRQAEALLAQLGRRLDGGRHGGALALAPSAAVGQRAAR